VALLAPVAIVPADEQRADALFAEALHLLDAGRTEEAAAKLREAIGSDARHWRSHCALGQIMAAASRLAEAEAALEASAAIHPDPACLARLAQVLLVQEKLDRAEEVLRRAAALDGASDSVLYNLARLLDRSERFDEAVEIWQRYLAVATDPARRAAAQLRAGRILVLLGRPVDAIAHYRAVLQADPGKHDARSELAAALMQASRHDEAWAEYEMVIGAGAADAAALSNAGSICQLRGDLPRAVELLSRSVTMDRTSMPTRIALAMAQARSGDDPAAIATLEAIVADDPDNVKAWFLMGQSLRKLGRVEEARRAMQRHEEIHERIMRERMAQPGGDTPR
jgi:tetratricopeptide (TPR) repeat protein